MYDNCVQCSLRLALTAKRSTKHNIIIEFRDNLCFDSCPDPIPVFQSLSQRLCIGHWLGQLSFSRRVKNEIPPEFRHWLRYHCVVASSVTSLCLLKSTFEVHSLLAADELYEHCTGLSSSGYLAMHAAHGPRIVDHHGPQPMVQVFLQMATEAIQATPSMEAAPKAESRAKWTPSKSPPRPFLKKVQTDKLQNNFCTSRIIERQKIRRFHERLCHSQLSMTLDFG